MRRQARQRGIDRGAPPAGPDNATIAWLAKHDQQVRRETLHEAVQVATTITQNCQHDSAGGIGARQALIRYRDALIALRDA
jgi:hypothetical protein